MPKLRLDAARLLKAGWSTRQVARHTSFNQSTIVRWSKKDIWHQKGIPTLSSRPHHHPKELSNEIIEKIIGYRHKHNRCAQVLHYLLNRDGIAVSLSSVKRTLRRYGLVNHSRWKKWHTYPERPKVDSPGVLVEIDTIWDGPAGDRLYLYTMLDVCCRWAYAWPTDRISTYKSLYVVKSAQIASPFKFGTIQSDHGSEFSKYFTKQLVAKGLSHRHSRVRMPSDNGHLERFNRTIQEECLSRIPKKLSIYKKEIPQYLKYYNEHRPHMALNMKSPLEVMRSY
jgi:transposase InsO family protein